MTCGCLLICKKFLHFLFWSILYDLEDQCSIYYNTNYMHLFQGWILLHLTVRRRTRQLLNLFHSIFLEETHLADYKLNQLTIEMLIFDRGMTNAVVFYSEVNLCSCPPRFTEIFPVKHMFIESSKTASAGS